MNKILSTAKDFGFTKNFYDFFCHEIVHIKFLKVLKFLFKRFLYEGFLHFFTVSADFSTYFSSILLASDVLFCVLRIEQNKNVECRRNVNVFLTIHPDFDQVLPVEFHLELTVFRFQ